MRLLVEARQDLFQPLHFEHVGRQLIHRHPELEVGRSVDREREGDVLRKIRVSVSLLVRDVELFQLIERFDLLTGECGAHFGAQRMVGGRSQVAIIASRIDRGHDGEECGIPIELILLLSKARNRGVREQTQKWGSDTDTRASFLL